MTSPHDSDTDPGPDSSCTGSTHRTTSHRTVAAILCVVVLLLAGGSAALAATGTLGASSPRGTTAHLLSAPAPDGYWLVGSDGGIFSYGGADFYGSTGNLVLNRPIVGMAATPDSKGYWTVASDGGIFAFGDAGFYGSTGAMVLNEPIVGMSATPSGHGYWLAASDGGVFRFGDGSFAGSTGNIALAGPVGSISGAPSGQGYWMAASDGGVFSFGSAGFHGSAVGLAGSGSVVELAPTPDGAGYWMTDSNGAVFAFGDAVFFGSANTTSLEGAIVGMARSSGPAVNPQDYTISGNAPGALLPGTSSAIDLRITNPNVVSITLVSSSTTITTSRGACAHSNFTMVHELHLPVTVPAGASVTLSQLGVPPGSWPTVGMVETGTNQDACTNVTLTLTLHYAGEAIG